MTPRKASLKYCLITSDGWRVEVKFPNGLSCPAVPHTTPHYHIIAHRCGYEDDVAAYCFEHEVAHAVVAEYFWDSPSPVLLAVAEGKMLGGKVAAFEELMAQTVQRYARAGERPIIGGVDWGKLRDRFLEAVQ